MKKPNFLKLLPLCFLLIFVSCGEVRKVRHKLFDQKTSSESRQYASTNPVFAPYIAEFEAQGKTRLNDPNFSIGDIPVNFGDTESYAGLCITYSDGKKEILIDEESWNDLNFDEVTLYHELGHCRLGHDHDDRVVEIGKITIGTSVMNSVLISPVIFNKHKEDYLHELFTKDRDAILNALNK